MNYIYDVYYTANATTLTTYDKLIFGMVIFSLVLNYVSYLFRLEL